MGKGLPGIAVSLAALALAAPALAQSPLVTPTSPAPAPAPSSPTPPSTAADLTPALNGQLGAQMRGMWFVWARAKPSLHARKIERVWSNTGFSRRRMVLPVVSQALGGRHRRWLQVRLPSRPNGHTGWIPARSAKLIVLHWRIQVIRSKRRARLYRDGVLVRTFRVVVGARHSPTPLGHYFVIDRVLLHVSWAPRKWALATSAYSNVFRHFDGGEGEIALHAKGFLGARLGTAASHGCVRFADRDIAWLVKHVQAGTPVDVVRRG